MAWKKSILWQWRYFLTINVTIIAVSAFLIQSNLAAMKERLTYSEDLGRRIGLQLLTEASEKGGTVIPPNITPCSRKSDIYGYRLVMRVGYNLETKSDTPIMGFYVQTKQTHFWISSKLHGIALFADSHIEVQELSIVIDEIASWSKP